MAQSSDRIVVVSRQSFVDGRSSLVVGLKKLIAGLSSLDAARDDPELLEGSSRRLSLPSREHAAHDPQQHDDRRFDQDHLNVDRLHSAALRSASLRLASASAPVAPFHHASSSSSCWREARAARAVSSGAGPPCVLRTLTKWRALRILPRATSEYASGEPSTSRDAWASNSAGD